MEFRTITCSKCRQKLTVSENAPLKLTCPRCLGSVDNAPEPRADIAPRPVIPIEEQARSDSSADKWLLLIVLLMIGFGALLALSASKHLRAAGGSTILVLTAAALAAYFILSMSRERQKLSKDEPPPPPIPPRYVKREVAPQRLVLEYGEKNEARGGRLALQLLGGFAFTIAVGVFGLWTGNVALAVAVIGASSLATLCISQVRAFGLGMLIAVILCIILPIGMCFATLAGVGK